MVLGAGGLAGLRWAQSGRCRDAVGDPFIPCPPCELHAATRASSAFGARVSVTAMHEDLQVAGGAADAALGELRRVDELMSLYRPDSPLSRLNREGRLAQPDPGLAAVLRYAAEVSRRTGGAFDVTVQPLWDIYAQSKRAGSLPGRSEIETALGRVDWRRVELSDREVRLHGRGAAVTLNGLAQGFAGDRALAALRRHGVGHALVESGEVGTLGGKAPGDDWTVGIQHPRRGDAWIAMARLNGRCLATSGDYETRFSDDFRANHLFDPRTGRSPEHFASVSVAARTGLEADALSTALFVLGPEEGLKLLRGTPGADALLVFKDGRTLATGGFPAVSPLPTA